MANGTVKFFNTTKGYGFIAPEDGSNDVFVHVSALEQSGVQQLRERQRVSFEVESKNGKTFAVQIQLQD